MRIPDKAMSFGFNDVNEAYLEMQYVVKEYGQWEDTRNGRAKVLPVPVILSHFAPWRRVLFDTKRDANPFFHYMEAVWMLAGSENVDFPAHFAKNILNYSDDGVTLHGAYGFRWRQAFERDQIDAVMHILHKDPQSRRCVISMWDPHLDLERDTKDAPCNTQLYFRVVDDQLTMTILNRSNDLVWGMLGANIVHMSILQEYIATSLEMRVGTMYQMSNNVHVYDGWDGDDKVGTPSHWYQNNPSFPAWKFSNSNLDIDEAYRFTAERDVDHEYESRIMRDNVLPMYRAWDTYKMGDMPLAIHLASHIYDADWREACIKWLMRRVK